MQVIQGGKPSNRRGGVRPGAGRKRIGEKRQVSITLPDSEWEMIDKMLEVGQYSSYSEYFRTLHEQEN